MNSWDRGEVQNLKELFGTNILTFWMPFGREIENEFIFEKMNPFVRSKDNFGDRTSPEAMTKRLAGKAIKVNGEIVRFDKI